MKTKTRNPELKINFIQPDYEILDLPDADNHMAVLQHLESIGRTCYKSEDKITDESCFKFVEMIRDRKHWAMLEHFVFTIDVPVPIYNDIRTLSMVCDSSTFADDFDHDYYKDYYKLGEIMKFMKFTADKVNGHDRCLISTSATTINNILMSDAMNKYLNENFVKEFEAISKMENTLDEYLNDVLRPDYETLDIEMSFMLFALYIERMFPELIMLPDVVNENMTRIPLKSFHYTDPALGDMFPSGYIFKMLSQEEISNLPVAIREIHQVMSVRFITDRGVTHEIVRHRPVSYAQESTRYCNYSKKGYQVILPWWALDNPMLRDAYNRPDIMQIYINDITDMLNCTNTRKLMSKWRMFKRKLTSSIFSDDLKDKAVNWLKAVVTSIFYYESEINLGMQPQAARSILHHSIKTEIVVTCNMMEWKHFFKMRADSAAHPDMQAIACPLYEDVKWIDPVMFKEEKSDEEK